MSFCYNESGKCALGDADQGTSVQRTNVRVAVDESISKERVNFTMCNCQMMFARSIDPFVLAPWSVLHIHHSIDSLACSLEEGENDGICL